MKNRARGTWVIGALLAVLVSAGCAGVHEPVDVQAGTGEQTVALKVSSFDFQPNHIVAKTGTTLALNVQSDSVMTHNLTIKAPDGAVLASVDIPSKGNVTVKVPLEKAGVYEFYCDKPMHTTLGMKGRIEAR